MSSGRWWSARRAWIPERIDDVYFGNANGAGEDNRDVGRMSALLAGCRRACPGTTINRLCGSSLTRRCRRAATVETGDASLTLVGGVESMSRAPWVLLKPERAFAMGDHQLHSTTLGWRMVNPRCRVSGRSRWARARRSSPASTHHA